MRATLQSNTPAPIQIIPQMLMTICIMPSLTILSRTLLFGIRVVRRRLARGFPFPHREVMSLLATAGG
jgi:hypothetical protein